MYLPIAYLYLYKICSISANCLPVLVSEYCQIVGQIFLRQETSQVR